MIVQKCVYVCILASVCVCVYVCVCVMMGEEGAAKGQHNPVRLYTLLHEMRGTASLPQLLIKHHS